MVTRRASALSGGRRFLAILPAVLLVLATSALAILPDDPRFPDQWSLQNTGDNAGPLPAVAGVDIAAPAAWNIYTGSRSVIVAISDSAFDLAVHPDLAANLLPPIVIPPLAGGKGFELPNEPTPKTVYHGSAIAGIIGAAGNNGLGMTGINWEVSLLPVRSSSLIDSRIQTIYAAADAGAGVVNISWDIPYFAQQHYLDDLYAACLYALEHDLLIVCSAGNDGKDVDVEPEYPCCYDLPNIICVTGLKPDGQQIFNYGDESVHLAAPGVRILAPAGGGGYDYVMGTSFATPMVAGVAALVRGRFPELDAASVKACILAGTVPMPELAGLVITGGRLDAFRALAYVASAPTRAQTDRGAWTATLLGGRPNPFNPRTEIRFVLARPGQVSLRLYDVRGRLVACLEGGQRPAGEQGITWAGRDAAGRQLPSGVYYGRLLVDGRAVGAACKLGLIR